MKVTHIYVCQCCDTENILCKHCGVMYPPTKDNFYTSNGKLKLDKCKGCKKIQSQKNAVGYKRPYRKDTRDRREYMAKYREKKRAEKQRKKEEEA